MSSAINAGVRRLRTLGERLRFARKLRDLGSNELNQKAGLSNGYVSSLEIGRRTRVQAKKLQAIARVLRVREAWLSDGIEPMEGPQLPTTPKENLERCLQEHGTERWLPHVIAFARTFEHDRTVADWERTLDELQAATKPIVDKYDRRP